MINQYLFTLKGPPDPFIRRLEKVLAEKRYICVRSLSRAGRRVVLAAAALLVAAAAMFLQADDPAEAPAPGSSPVVYTEQNSAPVLTRASRPQSGQGAGIVSPERATLSGPDSDSFSVTSLPGE